MASCQSCGISSADGKAYCEHCGAALGVRQESSVVDDDDGGVLSLMLGRVCPSCDSYNDPGATSCMLCRTNLDDDESPTSPDVRAPAPISLPSAPPAAAAAPSWMQAPAGSPLATAHAMPAVSLDAVKAEGKGLEAPSSTTTPAVTAPAGAADAVPVSAPLNVAAAKAAALATSGAVANCPKCKAAIEGADRFCASCGFALGSAATGAGVAPLGTMMMAAAPLPSAPTGNATMMMPSLASVGAPVAKAKAEPPPASATMFFGAATVERHARLILVKGHTQFGTQWRLQAGITVVGREDGMVLFPDDNFLSKKHCQLEFRGDALFLNPLPSRNGVFVRLLVKEEISFGGEIVIGLERLRLTDPNASAPPSTVASDDTKVQGSMQRDGDPVVIARVMGDGHPGEIYHRAQRVLTVGRSLCDLNFTTDPYLSTRHAQITRTARGAFVEDLGSRNGTFVRVLQPRQLQHGDVILMGAQVLRVELSLTLPRPS